MPFTFAHPAAVLPLRHIARLSTPALIIGSMTPDLPYFLPTALDHLTPFALEPLGHFSHRLVGTVAFDVPAGMLLLVLCFRLRRPLTALLGPPARERCVTAIERFASRGQNWLLAPVSLLLGAWTHTVWDSFTHANGWLVRRVPALSSPVDIGTYHGELCHVLQYASSVFGLAVLWLWYIRLPRRSTQPEFESGRTVRRSLQALILAISLGISALQSVQFASKGIYVTLDTLITHAIGWFAVLYLACGALLAVQQRRPEPQPQA